MEKTIYRIESSCDNRAMEEYQSNPVPSHCPVCSSDLVVTRLQCPACGTEVAGSFSLSSLATLQEPYASLITLFLRTRGNLKEMERTLGLSYPTVRARLEEALTVAGLGRESERLVSNDEAAGQRVEILSALERGEITAAEAAARFRELQTRRSP
jgi:hypothetical protein